MNHSDYNGVVLPSEHIHALYEAYQALAEACLVVRDAVRSDQATHPVYLPTFGMTEKESTSNDAREAAIVSITQLFAMRGDESLPDAGIVCASPTTVAIVEQLNSAKAAFKEAVMAIRNIQQKTGSSISRISKLVRDEVTEKGYRTEALKRAMGTARIGSLDLKRCYAQIRIMPPELDVFSWTWATNHSRIRKVTVPEAFEMAKKLTPKETSAIAVDLLSRCNPGEILVKKSLLPNQLRVNYAYVEDGTIVRKSCPISGMVIAQQEHLPRRFWRDNPGKNRRRPAQESKIEDTPFIESLDLYRYAQ